MPKSHLGTRHLFDAIAVICIGIFALLHISNLIQLNFSNSSRLIFSDLIQLPIHALYFWFKQHNPIPIQFNLQGVPHLIERPKNNPKAKLWNIPKSENSNWFWQGHYTPPRKTKKGKKRKKKKHPPLYTVNPQIESVQIHLPPDNSVGPRGQKGQLG